MDGSSIDEKIHQLPGNRSRDAEHSSRQQQQEEYFSQLFHRNAKTPVRVRQFNITGSDSIKDGVLQRYLEETVERACNFEELCDQSDILTRKLVSHGLAQNVLHSFDSRGTFKYWMFENRAQSLPYSDNSISPTVDVLDIISNIHVQPVKKFMAKTGTNIGNGEGDGYLQFQLRNILGNGEQLKLDVTKGTKTHSSYLVDYTQPLNPWWLSNSYIFKNSRQLGNSAELLISGYRCSVTSDFTGSCPIKNDFYHEAAWRNLKITSLNASDTLLFQAGEDYKSSIGHSISWNVQDNVISPSRGHMIKWNNELAFGKFWKTQFEVSKAKSWFEKDFITMTASLRTGYILNFHPKQKPIHLHDKFQNGGGNDIRGFQLMGLGPRDFHDMVGGDAMLAYGISIFSRLPIKKWSASNFRLHWFLNGGRLISHNNASVQDTLINLLSEQSTAAGVGIVLRHPAARFELNFTLPLTYHRGDLARKGFQYGIGLSFL